VIHLPIRTALTEGLGDGDTFFFCTSYSPDNGRLSASHPEIREGSKYQVLLSYYILVNLLTSRPYVLPWITVLLAMNRIEMY
jgi:hypothetical protein